jgi:hypothetical protein
MALDEERGRETPPQESDEAGTAGGEEPSLDAEPETEDELKDYGPPADMPEEAEPDEVGEDTGAEEGISPWAPEGYSEDAEGPTQATEGEEKS